MAFKQNNKQIKKIIKELKGASKLHAGQAEKLEKMVDDSPFRKEKGKKGKKNKKDTTASEPSYKDYAAKFSDFNPKSDTLFVGQSLDMGVSRKKAGMKGNISINKGASKPGVTGEKIFQGEYPSGQTKYTTVRKYTKTSSPAQKRMGKFKDSKAPDAEGKFRDLAAPALASWMIKSRKVNLSKIISSLNQQIIFRRNKDPKYAAKMRRTQDIVRKRLGKDKK